MLIIKTVIIISSLEQHIYDSLCCEKNWAYTPNASASYGRKREVQTQLALSLFRQDVTIWRSPHRTDALAQCMHLLLQLIQAICKQIFKASKYSERLLNIYWYTLIYIANITMLLNYNELHYIILYPCVNYWIVLTMI